VIRQNLVILTGEFCDLSKALFISSRTTVVQDNISIKDVSVEWTLHDVLYLNKESFGYAPSSRVPCNQVSVQQIFNEIAAHKN
jgi:hypothetical protein